MRVSYIRFGTIAFFLLIIASASTGNTSDSLKTITTVDTPEKAVDRALRYTGFGDLAGFSKGHNAVAKMIRIHDDQTPFLHDSINNRPIWEVEFDGVNLQTGSIDSTLIGRASGKFYVLLDSISGCLLKITWQIADRATNIAPEPSAEFAEKQLSSDRYHSFVAEPPVVRFREAESCAFRARLAKQLSAILVMYTSLASKYYTPKPVWIMTLRGMAPFELPAGRPVINGRQRKLKPSELLDYIHQGVDATSGKLMFWTSVPTPEAK